MAPEEIRDLWDAVERVHENQGKTGLSLARIEEQLKAMVAANLAFKELLSERCEARGMEICSAKDKIDAHEKAIIALKERAAADHGQDYAHGKVRDAILIFVASGMSGIFLWIINHIFK